MMRVSLPTGEFTARSMFDPAIIFGVLCTLVFFAHESHATVIYRYEGNPFTNADLVATPGVDKVTGYVEFATKPLPNETGKSDVTAFLFKAASSMLTHETATFSSFLFNFDNTAIPQIIKWDIDVILDRTELPMTLTQIKTCSELCTPATDSLLVEFPGPLEGFASVRNDPGTWSVPEPPVLILLLSGMVIILLKTKIRS